jgi:hypothetical protein
MASSEGGDKLGTHEREIFPIGGDNKGLAVSNRLDRRLMTPGWDFASPFYKLELWLSGKTAAVPRPRKETRSFKFPYRGFVLSNDIPSSGAFPVFDFHVCWHDLIE